MWVNVWYTGISVYWYIGQVACSPISRYTNIPTYQHTDLTWLRWIALGLIAISTILIGIAIPLLIKARRGRYYFIRREALKRSRRWMLAALVLQVIAVDILILLPYLTRPVNERAANIITSPSPTLPFTPTPRPTRTPTTTPTRRPTATAPFIPTATPAATPAPPPDSALTPIPSAIPAGEDARISIITLAADRNANGQPVDPGSEFPPGDHRVYLFISYEGLSNGVPWTFAIYREEELMDATTALWEWNGEGKTYLYYKPPGGYEPGTYEMRVFIEDQLQGIAQFVIAER